jgi:hypothetical protein
MARHHSGNTGTGARGGMPGALIKVIPEDKVGL